MMDKPKHKYNVIPDKPDSRDFNIRTTASFKLTAVLPKKVDLRVYCSSVEDQGDLGSCTGNAIVGAIEFLENKLHVLDGPNDTFVDLSRLFVYYNERVLENTTSEDAGASIRDGIKSLVKWGVCTESLWPYKVQAFANKPSSACYVDAANRKISVYARVSQNIKAIKTTIASGYPIIFGFIVYESFESDYVARTGIVRMPSKLEQPLGGHAVLCVGYDDSSGRVLVRNSWGNLWGQGGYFTMPYAYISDPNLACDFWVVDK